MAERTTQFPKDEKELTQTKPMYLSSDDGTASLCCRSTKHFTEETDAQNERLNQFVVHPNKAFEAAQVTILNYDVDLTRSSLSVTTSSEKQVNKHIHNVSAATARDHPQSGSLLIKIRLKTSPLFDSLVSPMQSTYHFPTT